MVSVTTQHPGGRPGFEERVMRDAVQPIVGRLRWLTVALSMGLVAAAAPAIAQSPEPTTAPSLTAASPSPGAGQSLAPSSPGPSLPIRTPGPPPPGALALPAEGGPLEAGTYGSYSVGPAITFTVDEGWIALPDIPDLGWGLLRLPAAAPAVLSFTVFDGTVPADPCSAQSEDSIAIGATPEALFEDFAANPNLVTSAPEPIELAGHTGLVMDVATLDLMTCEPPVVVLWSVGLEGGFVLEAGEEARFIALDVDGRIVIVSMETYPGADLDAFIEDSQPVIDSVTFGPAASPAESPAGSPAESSAAPPAESSAAPPAPSASAPPPTGAPTASVSP
jgi:hypothetical protein